ncbi:23S rRNA (uracil(1939)-C(5))-methyltransferase RlmD [Sporanaerobium hydrogeniformans]|uniref:23S rRNA (Uracil(1939)-C(5))-methyltransferase RlmD n=1 Tax=Sporanaerobium hydrogeniformans TaxID=3072179 RepID=A0AC61DI04_9FIRM|nr:23S rRNA (uracil(1939)-C(5))-methyltransferase RlmD [Sporanaerobium hydrogeniformans]PHV72388.1 23S rRNA (uracil(1939)-C(5))-methyltransferase RlmD [Sporanaerobium hydrogeniformans]
MEQPVKKNDRVQLRIQDMGSEGEGIGKVQDFTLFVPHTVAGDEVEVLVLKTKKSYGYGKLLRILTPSPLRSEPLCQVAHQCGGCQLQHLQYKEQLKWKTQKVKEVLRRIGGLADCQVEDTLGMEKPFHYRNKVQYPIRREGETLKIGFFAKGSHRVVASEVCHIQDKRAQHIVEKVRDYLEEEQVPIYNEETHQGLVRHLLIKTAYHTPDIMVCLVINGENLKQAEKLVGKLRTIPGVASILLNHHKEKSNVILGAHTTVLYGTDTIIDKIGDLQFKISPLSFFQVNPMQTEVLYQKVLEFADLTGEETIWDAYCGIGTISLFLAKKAKHVYGVEIVPEAIEMAKENARLNGLTNVTFFTGKAEEIIPNAYKQGIVADTIVVDPPRKGCDSHLLATLIDMSPNKIVYVSCDPATLARDLKYLTNQGYQVDKVQPVDMFPQTVHCEVVTLLQHSEK